MNWKKELARDLLALGSIPFYFIVIVRAVIGEYLPFVYRLVFALAILFVLEKLIKYDKKIARGFILVVFTSFFYNALPYTVFAALLWLGMIYSSAYLKTKGKEIIYGVLFGVVSSALGYLLSLL